MMMLKGFKRKLLALILMQFLLNGLLLADPVSSQAKVTSQIFDKVKQNDNWKLAFLTAK